MMRIPQTPLSLAGAAPGELCSVPPLLGHGGHERAALAGRGHHLDVIARKLQQVPQRPRLHGQGVAVEVLLQVHRLHSFCERHLGTHRAPRGSQRGERTRENHARLFCSLFETTSSAFLGGLMQYQGINPSANTPQSCCSCLSCYQLFLCMFLWCLPSPPKNTTRGRKGYIYFQEIRQKET